MRNQYIANVQKGIEDGWLSPTVDIDKVSRQTAKIPVHIGSIFDMNMEYQRGYFVFEGMSAERFGRHIVLGTVTHDDDGKLVLPALQHELNHGVLQTAYQDGEDISRSDPMYGAPWLYESLTCHVDNVMERGDVEVISDMRDNSYQRYAELLTFVLRYGQEIIDPAVATRAYSGNRQEREEFYEMVDRSWGVKDALGKISGYMQTQEKACQREGKSWAEGIALASEDTYRWLYANPKKVLGEECEVPSLARLGEGSYVPIPTDKGSRAAIELRRQGPRTDSTNIDI